MAITIGNSSIKNIYVGDSKVKAVYLGDNLVYGGETDTPVEEIDTSYNYFVFDTSKVKGTTTVILQRHRGGDNTEWDSLTDWGDGTIDSKYSHKYAEDGIYTVKTKYKINDNYYGGGDTYTREMLIQCLNINKNMTSYFYLFYGCRNLIYVNLSSLDTSKVTNMECMFGSCISLPSLDLSSFNTKNVTTMREMFRDCSSLTSLDLLSFDTSNVTNMMQMFYYCDHLTSLDLSNFNTENVIDMSMIFSGCKKVQLLDISNWNMDKTTEYTGLFIQCYPLIYDHNKVIMTNCNDATKAKITEALNAE